MTEKIYYHSDTLTWTSNVASCTPQQDGYYHVVLSSTPFHPQGGGQPSDKGTINNVDVVNVLQDGNDIIHIVTKPLALESVNMQVDEESRALHSRYHSAGHLIATIGERFGWHGSKGNHRPGEGRVVFKSTDQAVAVTEEDFQSGVAKLVERQLIRIITENDGVRMVTWEGLAPMACGGTHVQSTGCIGKVVISRVKLKKGELSVSYSLS